MGLMDKIKGFFYDEEEIEEEVKVPVKRELPKKRPIILDEEEKEVPERELFRAERTFNFPMDMDDDEEPDFIPVKKSIKEEKIVNNITDVPRPAYSSNTSASTSYRSYSAIKPQKTEPKEEKKFKPTPIISPIYGIMEGEIRPKEEPKELLFNDKKDLSITKRIDFDTVRQKAYGSTKSDYIEKTEEEDSEENENKGIFFNLVDDKEEKELEKEDITVPESAEEDDIKITYNDVDYDDEKSTEEDEDDEIEIPKITRSRTKRKVVEEETDEDAILSETKEQDLFNLIDNMYNSEDEEDDE